MANSEALPSVISVPPCVTNSRSASAPASPIPPAYCAWNGAGLHAIHDLARGHFGDDDGVELIAQVAGLNVGVVQAREGEVELFEDPARPALVDVAGPWLIDRRCAAF